MQELLTPVTIGNEQYYSRKATDAALRALNATLNAKTEENARMVVRCSELRRAHDNLSRAYTDLESRYDDLYKDWAAVVEISRKAIGGLNSLRKLVGRLRKALYIAHALRSKHLRWYLSSILELSTSGVISTPTWFGRGSEQIEACKKCEQRCRHLAETLEDHHG